MKIKFRSSLKPLVCCCLLFAAGANGKEAGWVVTARAGPHGAITPGRVTVTEGQTAAFTVIPEAGYAAMVSGCGGSVSGTTYTTAPVRRSCRVRATFLRVIPPDKQM